MRILLTGASGLIGSALGAFFRSNGDEVYQLTRKKAASLPYEIPWNPAAGLLASELLEGFEVVIHLGGEPLVGRWTESKKQAIMQSRVEGTRLLADGLSTLAHPPRVFISASAIGYYGSCGERQLLESSPQGKGFLAEVCAAWEAAARPAARSGIRTVFLRTGMVLSPQGGALNKMLLPFKLGLGGILGTGNQYMSWIDLDDLVRAVHYLVQEPSIQGPVNMVAPFPVTNTVFTKTLARALHRPASLRMPKWLLSLLFGEAAEEILLASQRVEPSVLLEKGFTFQYPSLEESLLHLKI